VGTFGLYTWSGSPGETGPAAGAAFGRERWTDGRSLRSRARRLAVPELDTLSGEGLVVFPGEARRFMILSDDGAVPGAGGRRCKDHPDEEQRWFRAHWVEAPAPGRSPALAPPSRASPAPAVEK
jgi:hypothetical protein